KFDLELAVFSPAQLCERTPERCQPRLRSPIALRIAHQHADQPRPVRLLRSRFERPRGGRASNYLYEIAPSHCLPSGLGPLHFVITEVIHYKRNGGRPSFCVETIVRTECPLWVKSRYVQCTSQCPLYPQ